MKELFKIVKEKYLLEPANIIEKYSSACEDLIKYNFIKNFQNYENLIYRMQINKLDENVHKLNNKFGYFYEFDCNILDKINFGRAHHRVIYFVGKKKQITIRDLLSILNITKQSLSRVLNQLVKEKYIMMSTGNDKRKKNLSLTKKGLELERSLSKIQINKIKNIFNNSEEIDINGFKKILFSMIDEETQKKFEELNK